MSLPELVAVARGEKPADFILKNARIINVFNGTLEEGNVAIYGEHIAGIGDYKKAKKIIDLKGSYLAPGLLSGHAHIESSMLHPVTYAEAVIPRGTSSVFTDLHEITNVCGFDGMNFVMKWAKLLPMDMFFMVPSCVPATDMETSGAVIDDKGVEIALELSNVVGLGEMMNFPGVIFGVEQVLNKLIAAGGKVIDGHAPGVNGLDLNAYISAGIASDHECTRLEEAQEKLARGMHIMIREGSSEKNLEDLLPLVTDKTYKRCLFVVDDRSCSDLLREGDIDAVVRKAIKLGMDPVRAIQMATINTAEYFRLFDRGAIGPGYIANLINISDLNQLKIEKVIYKGKLVAEAGTLLEPVPEINTGELTDTVRIKPFNVDALKLKVSKDTVPVIEIIPGQIITRKTMEKIKTDNGIALIDPDRDILKLAVIERHKSTGNIGLALVKGFGLKRGALASSVAHDSHNIVAVGASDTDILTAVKELEKTGGGLTVCADGKIIASLALPIAGLLSQAPLLDVVNKIEYLEDCAAKLGALPPSPFALLSFLALPVIPELKLTDRGLVDVLQFKIIEQ